MGKLNVGKLVERFQLEVVNGEEWLDRPVEVSDISRPGLEMAGYFTYYPADRVQMLGKTELTFFERLKEQEKKDRMFRLCHPKTPCICLSRDMAAPEQLIMASQAYRIPVLRSSMTTTQLISKLTSYLESQLAPMVTMHGVLVDLYGVGVLITGDSGIGKSETALELVKRGHRLVADDHVQIRQLGENELVGNPPELTQHLLEIRGLGIINVMTLFGAGAIRNFKKVTMVCHLENWDENKQYDRLGLDENKIKLIDTYIPELVIPVRPGRNLAVIIEVAAMNLRLKRLGMDAAESFAARLTEAIEDETDDL